MVILSSPRLLDGELEEFRVKVCYCVHLESWSIGQAGSRLVNCLFISLQRDTDEKHAKDLKRTTHSFLPSPLPPTPSPATSQAHHRPSSPLLTPPCLSSEAKQSGSQSSALPPTTLSLSEVKRKQLQLKHTFTFDEEQIGGNLPKFLSNQ